MSMAVGDSTDLINGGSGGGVRNFWRSRTSCERKLLVAVMVMAVIIVGLAIAVAVVANMETQVNGTNIQDSVTSTCAPHIQFENVTSTCSPHSNFEDKHVCPTCKTPEDALTFTKEHRNTGIAKIPLNTVFDGHGILYSVSNYSSEETCLIMKPVNTWHCFNNKTSTRLDQTEANGMRADSSKKKVIWTHCNYKGLCTGHSAASTGHLFAESMECSVTTPCNPHIQFQNKHVCPTCYNTEDALTFTKEHRNTSIAKIPLNTVFDGHSILYSASSYNNQDTCLIMKPVKTWNCFHNKTSTRSEQTAADGMRTDSSKKKIMWTNCSYKGLCTGHSAASTGHLFAESMECL